MLWTVSTPELLQASLTSTNHPTVLQDELETAMQMIGITKLSQAHPGLLNTTELDPYIIRGDGHPYLKKIVRRQSKL